jgi:uncharacterized protein
MAAAMPPRVQVVVMAKAPVPGLAKTRLIPALGAEGAARLARRLLVHAVQQARAAAAPQPVLLACAPHTRHPAFVELQAAGGLTLVPQSEGDLGQRMQQAFDQAFASAGAAVLLGTDAPALDAARLRDACAALADADAVFVPAVDGGYALIGLRRPAPMLFEHMPWSTDRVMALTRERLAAAGWRWAERPAVHDIDVPADLAHVPHGWLQGQPP